MTQTLSCPQGHQWPAAPHGSRVSGELRCPVCGEAVMGSLDVTLCNNTAPADQPAKQLVPACDVTIGPDDERQISKPIGAVGEVLDTTLQKPASGGGGPVASEASPPSDAYEILEVIGRGGMGVVYKATQLGLNRVVALKMILAGTHASAEDRIRFQIEAEAVAGMQHPNIVQVYDIGIRDGYPYLSLEYLGGGTLQQKLSGARLDPWDAAHILRQLAQAVHYAHQRGIVHRDLKPANILFTSALDSGRNVAEGNGHGTPKVTDFGLAKRMDANRDHTQSGSILGTPNYMAPEQAAGEGKRIGPGTDIFALGAIFYDMLTGEPPFTGTSVVETLDKVRNQEAVPPSRLNPKVPRDLETICLKCLEKDPARRYATADELADDLHRFLNHEPILARPVSAPERFVKWVRRHPTRAALIALSVLLVLGAFGWVVEEWHDAEKARQAEVERHREQKLTEAAHFMHFMDEMREMYASEVMDRVKDFGIEITPDYKTKKGAIPVWATFVYELSERFRKQGKGQYTRLYSDYPFKMRTDGGPHDDFERQALLYVRQNPDKPYYRFEDYKGRPSLRYATADVMHHACVECHNKQAGTPKNDWKVGDVRGVLEVILPLD